MIFLKYLLKFPQKMLLIKWLTILIVCVFICGAIFLLIVGSKDLFGILQY